MLADYVVIHVHKPFERMSYITYYKDANIYQEYRLRCLYLNLLYCIYGFLIGPEMKWKYNYGFLCGDLTLFILSPYPLSSVLGCVSVL